MPGHITLRKIEWNKIKNPKWDKIEKNTTFALYTMKRPNTMTTTTTTCTPAYVCKAKFPRFPIIFATGRDSLVGWIREQLQQHLTSWLENRAADRSEAVPSHPPPPTPSPPAHTTSFQVNQAASNEREMRTDDLLSALLEPFLSLRQLRSPAPFSSFLPFFFFFFFFLISLAKSVTVPRTRTWSITHPRATTSPPHQAHSQDLMKGAVQSGSGRERGRGGTERKVWLHWCFMSFTSCRRRTERTAQARQPGQPRRSLTSLRIRTVSVYTLHCAFTHTHTHIYTYIVLFLFERFLTFFQSRSFIIAIIVYPSN